MRVSPTPAALHLVTLVGMALLSSNPTSDPSLITFSDGFRLHCPLIFSSHERQRRSRRRHFAKGLDNR
jgi:hypothetical protein